MEEEKLELITDFYEIIMANGYLENNIHNQIAYFDLFFKRIPDKGGYVIAAGLEQAIKHIMNLKFDESQINYLKSLNMFSEKFLKYLKEFRFTGDLWAIPEGTVVFPNEPIITVRAPIIEAQLLETILLLDINYQSIIATKINRIINQANGKAVFEFGARRADTTEIAINRARASIIGGASGSSCTLCGKKFNLLPVGTMAYSWVQSFDSEYEAFKVYAETYPEQCILIVDTYRTLESGIPNAIKVFDEVVIPKGFRPKGIRLDNGDLVYISKRAREMLDAAGYSDCKIIASNSLDENDIRFLLEQDAKIDIFCVGENLITIKSESAFGGVYKLTAIEENKKIIPKIRLSENMFKIPNPSFKKLYRLYDLNTKKTIADIITLHNEILPKNECTIFDLKDSRANKVLKNYTAVPLQKSIFENGKLVYESPTLKEISDYARKQIDSLYESVKRIEKPQRYIVGLSKDLYELKNNLVANS